MDVNCPGCSARYTANDEKLRSKTARMRCKACQTIWLVTGPRAERSSPAAGPDPKPEAKRAAVVKKGADREKRDLFAARELDEGSVKQTLHRPPIVISGVGARNENSILFRVDQLAGNILKSRETKSELAKGAATAAQNSLAPTSDDEGIIDLNALASAGPRQVGASVAPLFSEPPALAMDVDGNGRPAPRNGMLKRVATITAAIGILLLAGVGVSLAFQSDDPVAHTAAAATSTISPASTASTAETAATATATAAEATATTPPVVAMAPPTSEENETAEASSASTKPTKTKTKKGKGGKVKAGKVKAAKLHTKGTAAKPPKSADPCGCKGDLNCVIGCAARNGH